MAPVKAITIAFNDTRPVRSALRYALTQFAEEWDDAVANDPGAEDSERAKAWAHICMMVDSALDRA